MQRTRLEDRILPTYSKGEELFNAISHIVGGALGIVCVALCPYIAYKNNNLYGVSSGIIFGISMIVLYTMSSLYHGLSPNLKSKKVFQVLDHCAIFALIAGTYTPFALCTLREYDTALGWTIFGVVWGMAILGITLNSIDLKKFKVFSMICYLGMGWCIVIKGAILPELLGISGFVMLLLGGVIYTVGAILYMIGKKKKYMHSLFHVCICLGSFLHFLCIILYVM